ncbi:peptidylprolyl isomerase [Aquimonas sp.]|jgi:hypothetical protein|uniref:peptidylprolyl isomerase n=1 Tax=Aquimonas sp. TaxID=1872588 RepID=UPI0037C11910
MFFQLFNHQHAGNNSQANRGAIGSVRSWISFGLVSVFALGSAAIATAAEPATAGLERVIARQGEIEVTAGEFHAAMSEVPETERASLAQEDQLLTRLVMNIIRTKALAADAREAGTEVPFLKERLLAIERRLLAEQRIAEIRDSIQLPDLETAAREKYLVNRSQHKIPALGEIRYIALSVQKRGEQEARDLAIQLAERVQAGEDFNEVFLANTDEPESHGVDRGRIADYELSDVPTPDDTLSKSLLGKAVGEVGVPFKQRGMYFVPMLAAKTEARSASFEEVKDVLIEQLAVAFRAEEMKRRTSSYESSPLELEEELLPALRDQYLESGKR